MILMVFPRFFQPLAVGFRLFSLLIGFWRFSPVRASGGVSVVLSASGITKVVVFRFSFTARAHAELFRISTKFIIGASAVGVLR